jgi:hypothetical protein
MGILEAFRQIAPQTGDGALDRARNDAARLLFAELKHLAWSTALLQSIGSQERDEAIAVVLVRLVQAGPRGLREGDPCHDEAVRRYLRAALQNAGRDLLRDRQRADAPSSGDPAESEPAAPSSDASPEVQLDRKRAALSLEQAVRDLYDTVLPWIGAHRRRDASERAVASTDQLLGIYRGVTSVEQVLGGAAEDPAGRKRARQALYQQYHRTIEALEQAVDALERDGALAPERCRAVRTLVGELRLRKDDER